MGRSALFSAAHPMLPAISAHGPLCVIFRGPCVELPLTLCGISLTYVDLYNYIVVGFYSNNFCTSDTCILS